MEQNILLEACVESYEEAIKAEQKGAHRIELCTRLDLNGLTPDKHLIKQVIANVSIPVKVMIRPRGGNFLYSTDELKTMKNSIMFCKQTGVKGVVFGVLDKTSRLNLDQIQELAEVASPLKVTIHKAIDQTPDPVKSLEALLRIENVLSVLTSGGALSAYEGHEVIKRMLQTAKGKIKVIAGGSITKENLADIHHIISGREYHGRRIVGDLC